MTINELHEILVHLKAYKKERVDLGIAVVHHNLISELIQFCEPTNTVSHQACWTLEQSFLIHETKVYPFLGELSALLEMPINSSGMRSLTNIASRLCKSYYGRRKHVVKELLTISMRAQLVTGCFNELITRKETANLAYSIHALVLLGKEFDWIFPELIPVLEQRLGEPLGNGFTHLAKTTLLKIGAV